MTVGRAINIITRHVPQICTRVQQQTYLVTFLHSCMVVCQDLNHDCSRNHQFTVEVALNETLCPQLHSDLGGVGEQSSGRTVTPTDGFKSVRTSSNDTGKAAEVHLSFSFFSLYYSLSFSLPSYLIHSDHYLIHTRDGGVIDNQSLAVCLLQKLNLLVSFKCLNLRLDGGCERR